MIESKEIINIKYNYGDKWIQIKLDEKERYIKYDKDIDITFVEIKDKIKEKYYLLPNIGNVEFKIKIFIQSISKLKNLSYSEGKIKDIEDNELINDSNTKPVSKNDI